MLFQSFRPLSRPVGEPPPRMRGKGRGTRAAAARRRRGVAGAGGAAGWGRGWRRDCAMLRWLVAVLSHSCFVSKGDSMFYAVRKGRRTGVYRTW